MPLAPPLQQVDRTFVLQRGRRLSYFGGCDYFRLSSHPRVLRALTDGLGRYGLNVAASRSTTGNHILFGELEKALASFFSSEAALLVASGYATNLVVAQALSRQYTRVLVDQRSHASVMDALAFLGSEVVPFGHRDVQQVAMLLKRLGSTTRVLLVTDGMFSHDGSAAPIGDYLRVLPSNALLLVDDAHGAGVLGRHGRGTIEHAGVPRARVVQTISLSKAFGTYGGAVLCSRKLRDQIIERSRLYNGNTPLPLPLAHAALTSLRLLQSPSGQAARASAFHARLHANALHVKQGLTRAGLAIPDYPGPIVSIVPTNENEASRQRKKLLGHGVFPSLIRYPGSPASGFFRFMISSEHSRRQLDSLVAALAP